MTLCNSLIIMPWEKNLFKNLELNIIFRNVLLFIKIIHVFKRGAPIHAIIC